MAPHIVNAAYEPTQNSISMSLRLFQTFFHLTFNLIAIPAGQLTPPYFDVRLPAYVNYGSIGAVLQTN